MVILHFVQKLPKLNLACVTKGLRRGCSCKRDQPTESHDQMVLAMQKLWNLFPKQVSHYSWHLSACSGYSSRADA